MSAINVLRSSGLDYQQTIKTGKKSSGKQLVSLFWLCVHATSLFLVVSSLIGYSQVEASHSSRVNGDTVTVVKSDIAFPVHGDAPDPNQIMALVNSNRSQRGLKELASDSMLSALAEERAQDMVANSYYAHKDQNGKIFYDLLVEKGVKPQFACENLSLEASNSINTSVESWSNSTKGHNECMLDDGIIKAGYASVKLYDVEINGAVQALYIVVAIHST